MSWEKGRIKQAPLSFPECVASFALHPRTIHCLASYTVSFKTLQRFTVRVEDEKEGKIPFAGRRAFGC